MLAMVLAMTIYLMLVGDSGLAKAVARTVPNTVDPSDIAVDSVSVPTSNAFGLIATSILQPVALMRDLYLVAAALLRHVQLIASVLHVLQLVADDSV
jgi:hypothetical protein